jgi:hypothetical protein
LSDAEVGWALLVETEVANTLLEVWALGEAAVTRS